MLHWMTSRLYRKMIASHIGLLLFVLVVTIGVARWAFHSTIRDVVWQRFLAQTQVAANHLRQDLKDSRHGHSHHHDEHGWHRHSRSHPKNRRGAVPYKGAAPATRPRRATSRPVAPSFRRKREARKRRRSRRNSRWSASWKEYMPLLRRGVREASLLLGAHVRVQTKDGRCLMEARPARPHRHLSCRVRGMLVACDTLKRHRERFSLLQQEEAPLLDAADHLSVSVRFHEDPHGLCRLGSRWERMGSLAQWQKGRWGAKEMRWKMRWHRWKHKWERWKEKRGWGRRRMHHEVRYTLLQGRLEIRYRQVFPFPVKLHGSLFLVYALLILLGLLVAVVPISRGITSPLRELQKAVYNIQQGDLEGCVEVRGHDEVSELAESIEEMRLVLRELSQERKDLISDASHEIRTPLARIRTVAESVEDGLMREPERLTRAMNGICKQVDEVDQLLGDLLDIARFDLPNQHRLERSGVDVVALLEDTVRTQGVAAQTQGMELRFEEPTQLLPKVQADQRRLRQVLNNLIQNAIRYSPSEGEIRLSAEQKGETLWLKVSDQGPGIPLEEREKIFERFYRLDRSRSRRTGGQGLGLAIVKKIVQAHHGTIHVEDAEGGGACFCVGLPLKERFSE